MSGGGGAGGCGGSDGDGAPRFFVVIHDEVLMARKYMRKVHAIFDVNKIRQ